MNASSPYLRQHAHNPVFWYPWGKEALERAREENKPILLSIGYSTCYWCHVMERDIFMNMSIASLMNRLFINIKVDREEHPQLDEIYMVARQMMTQEGGWPNNVFLTPDLKPFYAGGTYGPTDMYGKPGFPSLLEWLSFSWSTQQKEVRDAAEKVAGSMQQFLVYRGTEKNESAPDVRAQADNLFAMLEKYYDSRAGGFFQSPKFPHECYLAFLLSYHELTGNNAALDMVTQSLGKMAAGGIYDHVGCGFHRYAVDKEWYIPHFEKMLYNQALLARLYTDAARITGNAYFADIARSVLEFVSGPMTDGNGGFYSAIDAETDAVEGAYYAWTSAEIEKLLTPEETNYFVAHYALADIPAFPGHKHVEGQVIVARNPLDYAARARNLPYVQLAALSGQIMNKLLAVRNTRKTPQIDRKIIVAWNGMMIDAFAHAGKVFGIQKYTDTARKAADYILEHAIDNEGTLCRIVMDGRAQIEATLEDYAFLIKGLISLFHATGDKAVLDNAISLMGTANAQFYDKHMGGFFFTTTSEFLITRIKSGDDSSVPNANAVMLDNLTQLHAITKDNSYQEQAKALSEFFLKGNSRILAEFASMVQYGLCLEAHVNGKLPTASTYQDSKAADAGQTAPDDVLTMSASLFPADAKPGENCEVLITLDIKDGWHINAHKGNLPYLVPTQIDIQGEGIEPVGLLFPDPLKKRDDADASLLVFEGLVNITARLRLGQGKKRPPLNVMLRYQPCRGTSCHRVQDMVVTI